MTSASRFARRMGVACVALSLLYVPATPQIVLQQAQNPPLDPADCMEAVAETKLLMKGINDPNFNALDRRLSKKPATKEAWSFSRGQALLIAETGNLLLLRPPRNAGVAVWAARAVELRETGAALALALGKQDYENSRAGMLRMTKACNRCHQTFQVATRVSTSPAQPKDDSID